RIPRNAVARKVVHLAKIAGGRVETVRKGATEKRPSYRLRLTLPPGRGSQDVCCARAILRGAFLARGLLGNPADAYHLELALREVAELRWSHPRAGLKELAELAQVSKSAVANRLRRLVVQANRNGLID